MPPSLGNKVKMCIKLRVKGFYKQIPRHAKANENLSVKLVTLQHLTTLFHTGQLTSAVLPQGDIGRTTPKYFEHSSKVKQPKTTLSSNSQR